jgi:uncharacterized SAM-binding protein YcdF (DUF218 family)
MNTAYTADRPLQQPRTSHFRTAGLLALVGIIAAAAVAFRDTGHWLIREDPIRRADIIVVLSGSMPYRAEEAANLFRMGYAREIWVSKPESPSSELAAMGIHYVGEEDYGQMVLVHAGVPSAAVHIFPHPIVDTEQEIDEIARQMRAQGDSAAIIVTSPQHTRRVRTLWSKLVGANPQAIVRAAPQDPFDTGHWWRNTRDAYSVVRELLGLLNAWAGLPSRPHPAGP